MWYLVMSLPFIVSFILRTMVLHGIENVNERNGVHLAWLVTSFLNLV